MGIVLLVLGVLLLLRAGEGACEAEEVQGVELEAGRLRAAQRARVEF
jgi:hypothetical protein